MYTWILATAALIWLSTTFVISKAASSSNLYSLCFNTISFQPDLIHFITLPGKYYFASTKHDLRQTWHLRSLIFSKTNNDGFGIFGCVLHQPHFFTIEKNISREFILPSSIPARGTLHCFQFLPNSCLGIKKKVFLHFMNSRLFFFFFSKLCFFYLFIIPIIISLIIIIIITIIDNGIIIIIIYVEGSHTPTSKILLCIHHTWLTPNLTLTLPREGGRVNANSVFLASCTPLSGIRVRVCKMEEDIRIPIFFYIWLPRPVFNWRVLL